IGRQQDRAAPDQRAALDIDLVMRQLRPDAGIKRYPVPRSSHGEALPQIRSAGNLSASGAAGLHCGDNQYGRRLMASALEEKDAIREVLAEYCFRLDDGRYDDMAALFTENGTWDTAFGKGTGRAAIAGLARDIRARAGDNRPRAIHLVTNIAIALDGDSAEVRS